MVASRERSEPADPAVRLVPALSAVTGSFIVFGCGAVFSFGGLAFRLTDDITSWQYVIFRGLGALVATGVILVVRYRSRLDEVVRGVRADHVAAGFLLAAMSAVFIVALDYASVAFVLFLQTLAPLAAAYFSWIMLRERVSRAVLWATAASVVGVLIMVSATLTDRIDPLGLIALLLPVAFGLYATLIRRSEAIDPQVPALVGGALLVVFGCVGSVATVGFDIALRDAAIGVFAGSFLLAIPVAIMNVAARVVPAPETALLLMGEVVLASVWVWIFVDETPAPTTIIGGAIIFAAVCGLLWWRRRAAAGASGR